MSDIFNPSVGYFGLEVAPDNTRSDSLASGTKYWAGMIRPTVSKNVTSLLFANWSHVGTFQTQTVELRTDAGGQPGTVLQSTTQLPASNFSWNSCAITSQAVTAGTAYWVVIYSASNSSSNSIEMRGIDDPDGKVSGVANKFSVSISSDGGSTWANQGSQWIGCVGLGYSDGSYEGCGYGDFDTYNINSSNNQWGEYFQVPSTIAVSTVGSKVYKNAAGTPTADLSYFLVNADTTTTLASGTLVTAAAVTTSSVWYDASIGSNVTLSPGVNYRFYMSSAASASPQFTYRPPKTVNSTLSNSMTFGGTSSKLANNNSGTYQTDVAHDTPFRLGVVTASGDIKVWTGTGWVAKPMKVWNGSAWVKKPVKVWNGSAWVVTNY